MIMNKSTSYKFQILGVKWKDTAGTWIVFEMWHIEHMTSTPFIVYKLLVECWVDFPQRTMNDNQSFQSNLNRVEKKAFKGLAQTRGIVLPKTFND